MKMVENVQLLKLKKSKNKISLNKIFNWKNQMQKVTYKLWRDNELRKLLGLSEWQKLIS